MCMCIPFVYACVCEQMQYVCACVQRTRNERDIEKLNGEGKARVEFSLLAVHLL